MIQTNELRIGNWVKTIYNELDYIAITEILDCVIHSNKTKCVSYSSLRPIPLTEEILLKCGFEKKGSTVYINIGSIEIGTVANGKRFYIQISSQNITLEIKYLHQLQNLYFALTNQELNIEL